MTLHAETVLYASLTDVEALEQLSDIGLAPECIPLTGMRDVVAYAVDYFRRSGRAKAPSRELLIEQWGHRLEQCQVELPDEDLQIDEVYTAIEYLRSQYALVVSQALQREIAVDLAQAEPHERSERVHAAAAQWHQLSMTLRDRSSEVEGIQGLNDSLARYEQRAAAPKVLSGMALGIEAVDQHTLGIHEGELAVWAGGAKAGKSWSSTNVARAEWGRQRETVLYTLENSVKMTFDRLACQTCGVDYRQYQKGTCAPEEITRVKDWLAQNEPDLRDGLHVISPEGGRRTPAALINQAHSYGAKSVIIDQLSHVEHPDPGRKPRHEIVRDIVVELANLISTGRQLLPLLLNVQVNREGIAAANKLGRLELTHLAESSEIERGSSWIFGLMRSDTEVAAGMATLQTIASRRMDLKHWRCAWEPWYGTQHALGEVTL
ncbi:DnaB-like helicase C-terminal domain-containing protein [Streptomyces sp. NPDC018055]|uniref:DnaB-like helicase C-terminal domain-containing protein n=1 Tax=Streptomyces sp. NPDC018055 TaxID=3365038 RepID=UPI003799AF9F